jgi:hypothetical protein
MSKDIAKRLATVGRKVLRRMSGGIKVSESWGWRYYRELIQLFGDSDLAE